MTKLLQQAFEKASGLTEEQQDQIGALMLSEMESEEKWAEAFASSQDELGVLARKALQQFEAGETEELGFDQL
jgi:hypothetical protein